MLSAAYYTAQFRACWSSRHALRVNHGIDSRPWPWSILAHVRRSIYEQNASKHKVEGELKHVNVTHILAWKSQLAHVWALVEDESESERRAGRIFERDRLHIHQRTDHASEKAGRGDRFTKINLFRWSKKSGNWRADLLKSRSCLTLSQMCMTEVTWTNLTT